MFVRRHGAATVGLSMLVGALGLVLAFAPAPAIAGTVTVITSFPKELTP